MDCFYFSCGGGENKIKDYVSSSDYGIMYTPEFRRPPKNRRYSLDNGAYNAYLKNTPFDHQKFLEAIAWSEKYHKPDFIVLPDIVAGGMKSLELSMLWRNSVPEGHKYYLAFQDGMKWKELLDYNWVMFSKKRIYEYIDGIFIGGTQRWKLRWGKEITQYIHKKYDLPVHIGRVGTVKKLVWCDKVCRADSADSSTIVRNGYLHYLDDAKKQLIIHNELREVL